MDIIVVRLIYSVNVFSDVLYSVFINGKPLTYLGRLAYFMIKKRKHMYYKNLMKLTKSDLMTILQILIPLNRNHLPKVKLFSAKCTYSRNK